MSQISEAPARVPLWRRRSIAVFPLLLVIAFILRVQLASTERYIHDEENTSIPLSRTISFSPANPHLPLRGENHGALPAYLVKVSGELFGESPMGYRAVHVALGLCTILLIYRLARDAFGGRAGAWAATLMAFNEYYLGVSSRATAHVPHLFFVTAAIYAFSRFLTLQAPKYLYVSGLSLGLAFYCKEHSALLLPLFLLTMLHPKQRRWLLRPQPYVACLLFALMVSPDLLWNLTTDRGTSIVAYSGQAVPQATYSAHLKRIGGIGFSPYPAMFYAKGPVQSLYLKTQGTELIDETPEYRSVNPALGVLLVAGAFIAALRGNRADDVRRLLILVFWGIFGFFTFIEKGNPPGRLDPASWIWVEVTLIPAVILTGAELAAATTRWRGIALAVVAALLVAACGPLIVDAAIMLFRAATGSMDLVRHYVDLVLIDTVDVVRRRPVRAVGLAVSGGIAVGLLAGFVAGWLTQIKRQRR